jgi:hypothetical protein
VVQSSGFVVDKALVAIGAIILGITADVAGGINDDSLHIGVVQSSNNLVLEGITAIGAAVQSIALLVAGRCHNALLHIGVIRAVTDFPLNDITAAGANTVNILMSCRNILLVRSKTTTGDAEVTIAQTTLGTGCRLSSH